MAPLYLTAMFVPTVSQQQRQRLHSSSTSTLLLPRTQTRYGDRNFAVAGPAAWNCLSAELRHLLTLFPFHCVLCRPICCTLRMPATLLNEYGMVWCGTIGLVNGYVSSTTVTEELVIHCYSLPHSPDLVFRPCQKSRPSFPQPSLPRPSFPRPSLHRPSLPTPHDCTARRCDAPVRGPADYSSRSRSRPRKSYLAAGTKSLGARKLNIATTLICGP